MAVSCHIIASKRAVISSDGRKRSCKVLRRRSDVEGRADMARTLPEGDPRYATDFLPRMDGAGCPPGGRGRLRFTVALAVPLPGTTYAGTRWSTLAYVEKVRSQFLSLRQPILWFCHVPPTTPL